VLPAFQVQLLKWTGYSGSNPERAALRYIPFGQSIRNGDFWLEETAEEYERN